MNRRTFLKAALSGAAAFPALEWPRLALAAGLPPHAEQLPDTPFDGPPGSWTLAVMPDSQDFSNHYPQVYDRQCEWIVAHRRSHNILFVAHEGDVTYDNLPYEWQNAKKSMDILLRAGIPYSVTTGNHDVGQGHLLGRIRATLINDYFHESDYASSPAYGLFVPGKVDNCWHQFDSPTGKMLVLVLEYAPRDVVVDWANQVVAAHPDCKVILVTHAYLYSDSTRYDWAKYGPKQLWDPKASPGLVADGNVNDGQDLWDKLVSRHPNIHFTLNGHVLLNGTGHLVSQAPDGHAVHQILANYQAAVEVADGAGGIPYRPHLKYPGPRPYGGGGFLRLMQFAPDGVNVAVKTYSPWYDRWLLQPDQHFTLKLA